MKIKRSLLLILVLILVYNPVFRIFSSPESELETQIIRETEAFIPVSIQMVDNAIEVLDGGFASMTTEERDLFENIFDPGATGTIDQAYVNDVVRNYIRIRRRLNSDLKLAYTSKASSCRGMRLYYTNYFTIYICPYFLEEDKDTRKARTLIHEATHIELLVLDRSYYDPNSYSTRFNALSPRPPIYTKIPLVGYVLREIHRKDTLYHPDAYAWFAGLLWEN